MSTRKANSVPSIKRDTTKSRTRRTTSLPTRHAWVERLSPQKQREHILDFFGNYVDHLENSSDSLDILQKMEKGEYIFVTIDKFLGNPTIKEKDRKLYYGILDLLLELHVTKFNEILFQLNNNPTENQSLIKGLFNRVITDFIEISEKKKEYNKENIAYTQLRCDFQILIGFQSKAYSVPRRCAAFTRRRGR